MFCDIFEEYVAKTTNRYATSGAVTQRQILLPMFPIAHFSLKIAL